MFVFLKKELLLLSRDLHALMLLFLMPTIFILIMSLAMQDTFSERSNVKIDYLLINDDEGESGPWLAQQLLDSDNFQRIESDLSLAEQQAMTRGDRVQFLVLIPPVFSDALTDPEQLEPLKIQVAPGTPRAMVLLFEASVRDLMGQLLLGAANQSADKASFELPLEVETLFGEEGELTIPTSVQQSVPAWLVFSMFFIAIPISTTLINERSQGTLDRLMTMNVSRVRFLASKLIPYLGVNLMQVVLMFMVGIWVVPLLGGDALTLGSSMAGLLVMAFAASFAAVAFALLVANIAKTSEQATLFAGISNIILAAIGGVMVPRFIMPPVMQDISLISPMAWGLEGFLDIVLRNGGVIDVLPEAASLMGFGMLMLLLSVKLLGRR
ncbi:MAG: hypothetical protein COC05_00710 [Gammaproteobacteria bacterium]|nr:MAG: hypothetical protein COC05_00710 [Gammaproteobacteria bacterium]